MKLFSSIFGFILILLCLAFAVSNRQDATISLWPLDMQVEAPLYLLTLGVLLFGILAGALFMWINMLPHRFQARRLHKDLNNLHDKLEELQRTIAQPVRAFGEDIGLLAPPKKSWRFWRRKS